MVDNIDNIAFEKLKNDGNGIPMTPPPAKNTEDELDDENGVVLESHEPVKHFLVESEQTKHQNKVVRNPPKHDIVADMLGKAKKTPLKVDFTSEITLPSMRMIEVMVEDMGVERETIVDTIVDTIDQQEIRKMLSRSIHKHYTKPDFSE